MKFVEKIFLVMTLTTLVYATPKERSREKAIGIFNIIQFPNDACNADSNSMNGTCYTAEECSSRSGTASGSCANGYGVCCLITVGCGQTSVENCTYLMLDASNTPEDCTYTICPSDTSISRIKLDMTSFTIAPPVTDNSNGGGLPANSGSQTGACLNDRFTVSGGSGLTAPVICGENSGQHMILDTDGTSCISASFSYGGDATSRSYVIHVVQYQAINEMGGPSGCLQFFTGDSAAVESFNWVAAGSTHLQNQNYNVCIRPNANMCVICWAPTTTGIFGTRVGSFGLSPGKSTDAATAAAIQGGAAAMGNLSGTGTSCATDYVIITQGRDSAAAGPASGADPNDPDGLTILTVGSRFCGNYFNGNVLGEVQDETVCTRQLPFRMTVVTDNSEIVGGVVAIMDPATNEGSSNANPATTPVGTAGFSLTFNQFAC